MINTHGITIEICDVIGLIETAPRIGKDIDEPEGVRYIQISDTLCKKIVEKLNDCLNEILE